MSEIEIKNTLTQTDRHTFSNSDQSRYNVMIEVQLKRCGEIHGEDMFVDCLIYRSGGKNWFDWKKKTSIGCGGINAPIPPLYHNDRVYHPFSRMLFNHISKHIHPHGWVRALIRKQPTQTPNTRKEPRSNLSKHLCRHEHVRRRKPHSLLEQCVPIPECNCCHHWHLYNTGSYWTRVRVRKKYIVVYPLNVHWNFGWQVASIFQFEKKKTLFTEEDGIHVLVRSRSHCNEHHQLVGLQLHVSHDFLFYLKVSSAYQSWCWPQHPILQC